MDHATLKWSQRELCGLLVQAVSGQVLAALERLVTSVFERFPSRVDRTFGREVLREVLAASNRQKQTFFSDINS